MRQTEKDEKIINITEDVQWIGVLDYDIVTFDVVMTTEFGTTYNSYFINAEKKAVIETTKEKFWDVYYEKLKQVCDPAEIEYIILNHTEPDHSGNVANLLKVAPKAVVVGSGNAIRYMKDLLGFEFAHMIVKDNEKLSLGNKTLKFISAPNLHWPDSMYTWLEEDKVLFTCDSFGAHYADSRMIDKEVGNWDDAFKYYFDVILKPYSKFLLKAIDKISDLDIKAICNGHGPLLTNDWKRCVDLSKQLSEQALERPSQKHVFIPYVSCYGKTEQIANAIKDGILEVSPDIKVDVLDVENSSIGELDEKIARSEAIIVGCPTINQNILLPIYKVFALISPLRDKGKIGAAFGSYGWSGEAQKLIFSNMKNLKLEMIDESVFVKFTAHKEDVQKANELGRKVAEKIKLKLNIDEN